MNLLVSEIRTSSTAECPLTVAQTKTRSIILYLFLAHLVNRLPGAKGVFRGRRIDREVRWSG